MPTSLRTREAPRVCRVGWPERAERWWPARWAQLASPAAAAAENMAVDLALLHEAGARGSATFRTYRWQRPTVSFGRHERVRDRWDVDRMRRDGFAVVRRPTGGRALLHLDDITWSVTLAVPRRVPWREVYDLVNAQLCAALRALGMPVACHAPDGNAPDGDAPDGNAPDGDAPDGNAPRGHARNGGPSLAPDGEACFAAPALGELVLGGTKVGGSSVWREGRGYLQHGSLLLHNRQALLEPYRLEPSSVLDAEGAELTTAPRTGLAEWLPNSSRANQRRRVEAALHQRWPPTGAERQTHIVRQLARAAELDRRARALVPSLDAPDWLWRR